MRRIPSIVLAALCIMAMILPALADGSIQGVSFTGGDGSYKRVVREGIVLGITPDPPHTFINEQTKQPDGIDVKIVEAAMRQIGVTKVSWQNMPFDSIISALLAKRIDVIVDDIHENPKRLAVIGFTSPVFYYGIAIAVRKGNPKKITNWQSLAGQRVGVLEGSFQFESLAARKDLKQLSPYKFSEAALADLNVGRVDAVVDDEVTIRGYINAHPGINLEVVPGADKSFPSGLSYLGQARFGVRKDDVDLNHAISRALSEMRADGTVYKIIKPYGFGLENIVFAR
jgi:polar amino acid transport system substrate-binding protein